MIKSLKVVPVVIVMSAMTAAAKSASFYLKQLQTFYQSVPSHSLGEKEWPPIGDLL